MRPVHVLITRSFSDEWLDRLRAVSPQLAVRQHPAETWAEVPRALWDWVEVLYTWGAFPDPADCPNLRWVQLDTSGSDSALASPLGRSRVAISTLIGVAPPNMAEHTLMMMMALGRNLPLMLRHQARSHWSTFQYRWDNFTPKELFGATVGILGYGSIGREIGRLAHAFNMRVIAITRSGSAGGDPRLLYEIPQIRGLSGGEPDHTYASDDLAEAAAQCDFLVLSVPHTPHTHHIVNESVLRSMKPTAVLINVARGGVVDEAALIRALTEKRIAGAALDVFEQEPLPADSPLWQMDNVIISPHIAGLTSRYYDVVLDLFSTNLQRYAAGEPLLNQVWPPQSNDDLRQSGVNR
ncbi:MAG: D-2-hydroxyacid dehydrogenase [Anaerolineae bacterium]|nr:D-2-hydroxyacid dehydrogenase [Anaerolineae bacterium]